MSNKSKILTEVSVIRPILIVLLVVYHSFFIYQGGWSEPDGFEPNRTYWWISKASYSFMLEAFVLISGYVFAYQATIKPHLIQNGGGKLLILSKLKRLILPSIIFSTIYFALYIDYKSVTQLTYTILNGTGHMWFLPMLFWCFIGCYYIEQINISRSSKLIGLILIALISYAPLPFRLNSAMYYLLFFFIGYIAYSFREQLNKWISSKKVVVLWIIFISVFVGSTLIIEQIQINYIDISGSILNKAIFSTTKVLLRIIYAVLGCLAIYTTALHYTKNREIPEYIIKFGNISMGVYIAQQFILMWLYYYTSLPSIMGSLWLPWVGFAIAFSGSLLLSWLFRQTKLGMALI